MENIQKENLENIPPVVSDVETQWQAEVTNLLPNLLYPSESDEPLEWIDIAQAQPSPLTINNLLVYLSIPLDTFVEEMAVENFWTPVTIIEEWYEEEERQTVAQFLQLKSLLETHLKNFQAFRVGQTEIDLYLLGQTANDQWAGLKTKVIET